MDNLSSHSSLGLPADHGKNFQKIKQFWVDLENQFSISSNASPQASTSLHQEFLDQANVSPIATPKEVGKQIIASKKIDWKAVSIRVLAFFAGAALGALTALASAGIMVTPVGWAIVGGVLAIALIGAAVYGGFKEFWKVLMCSVWGIISGTPFAAAAALGVLTLMVGLSFTSLSIWMDWFEGRFDIK